MQGSLFSAAPTTVQSEIYCVQTLSTRERRRSISGYNVDQALPPDLSIIKTIWFHSPRVAEIQVDSICLLIGILRLLLHSAQQHIVVQKQLQPKSLPHSLGRIFDPCLAPAKTQHPPLVGETAHRKRA